MSQAPTPDQTGPGPGNTPQSEQTGTPKNPKNGPSPEPQKRPLRSRLILAASLLGVWLLLSLATRPPVSGSISLTDATKAIASGTVESIKIDDDQRRVQLFYAETPDSDQEDKPGSILNEPSTTAKTDTATFPDGYGPTLVELATDAGVTVSASAPSRPSILTSLLFSMLPIVLIIGALVYLTRRSGNSIMNSVSKLPRGKDASKVPSDRFAGVAGLAEVVDELREVVSYLHEPEKFQSLGGKVPHGFLLVGPPGTGKTLLARAVAGEAGVPFFALSGSDFVETFVGVGAARVRSVFDEARKAGRAIVFIDELDAVGRARGAGAFSASNEESERTLNALLVEMDGYQRNERVIVLAATNRPEILDQALLRPGRFDRQILVPLPDRDARAKILGLHLKDRPVDADLDLIAFARRTPGCSGADLAFIVNEAALAAARAGATSIGLSHLESARAVAALGRERRSAFVSDKSRKITAWHEAGHALAALVLESVPDPVSVSIIPRGLTGGATWLASDDESFISRRTAFDQLTITLAGRAGEECLVGDDYTSGATGDLQQATMLARKMVSEWGFVPDALSFHPNDEKSSAAKVEQLLQDSLAAARALMLEHAPLHEALATTLLEEETLDADRLLALRDAHIGASAGKVSEDVING